MQKMSQALAAAGVVFEKNNPLTSLMADESTGTLRTDILDEKVLSAILEIKVPVARVEEVIRIVRQVRKRLDTVVVLGVGTRCDDNGDEDVVAPILERLGYKLQRAKTNLGLGRRVFDTRAAAEAQPAREREANAQNRGLVIS
jgi:hypothetical protein